MVRAQIVVRGNLFYRERMNRVIVTIHGTGRTAHNFWAPQIEAIAEHLGQTPLHRPVWWGDLIDAGAGVSRIAERLNARLHSLARQWLGRPAHHTPRLVSRFADLLHRWINGVAGVIAYFVLARERAIIRERLRATLQELTRHGDEIVLVSESLGRLQSHRYWANPRVAALIARVLRQ